MNRVRSTATGDEGIALVFALAIMGLVSVLMLTMVALSISDGKQTGANRARAAAVTSAEGAVDLTLAQVQSAALANIPCGGTVTNTQNRPDVMTITTTVEFFAANGAALVCPPPTNVVATQARIKSVSLSTPAGGGAPARRTIETLVALKPKFANNLDKAIFGNAGVNIGNHFDLYGTAGPDADVYTNGNFTCANNQRYRGSVLAQGTITLANTCTIDVNAWSKLGVTMSNGVVSGDVLVSNGNATITGGTIGGKVKAVDVSDAWCSANAAKCVEGASAAPPPPAQPFPTLNGDDATIAAYVAQGFSVVTKTNCTDVNSLENPGAWIADKADEITSKTLIRTPCRLSFKPNVNNVKIKHDLAVFADRGVDLSQTLTLESTDSTVKQLYLVQPADFQSRVSATCAETGISLTQQVQMTSTLKELLYSPCNVTKNNLGVLTGQIYGGGTVTIGQNSNITFSPLQVFGATSTAVVESYTSDVLYKRENVG